MKVTIHQPENFPYGGFFDKIKEADFVIFLDTVKFRKNYFQNRNKIILNGKEDWITVPVEKSANSKKICDVLVAQTEKDWKNSIISKIRSLNCDNDIIDSLNIIYSYDKIVDINMSSILWSLPLINGSGAMNYSMSSNIEHDSSLSKTELLVELLKKVGAKTYLSGPSGRDYLDLNLFEKEKINIEFFEPRWDTPNYGMSSIYRILRGK